MTDLDYEPGFNWYEFVCEIKDGNLWAHGDKNINTESAALFSHLLLKHFKSTGFASIEAAHTCGKAYYRRIRRPRGVCDSFLNHLDEHL